MRPYYEANGITVWLGDCLDVLPTLDAVDHVITDPPYARDVYVRMGAWDRAHTSEREAGRSIPGGTIGDALSVMAAGDIGSIDDMRLPVAVNIARVTRRWALVFSDVETAHLWRRDLETGMRYVRTGAWVKPDPMPQMSGDRPGVGFEPCTITHAKGAMRWNGGGHPAVWTHGRSKGADRPNHPCPKPLPLMAELVALFTDPGDLILDPFMGSGTTLVAAKQLGRRAIGIELEEKWAEAAVKRLESTTPPLFVVPSEKPTQSEMEVPA